MGKEGGGFLILLVLSGALLLWIWSRTDPGQEITWSRFKHDYLPYWKVKLLLLTFLNVKHYVEKIEIATGGQVAIIHTVGGVCCVVFLS